MSNINHQVKNLQQACTASDLQREKLGNAKSNVLTFKVKDGVAAPKCNTPYTNTKDNMHTVHAMVGITASDIPQYIRDIESMTEAALKKAYPKEHNSWRSRRDAATKESLPWSPKFDKFSGFLRIVGPKPKSNYQLDKIVKEHGYVPGNVRWVSPTENVINRDATRFITHNGETHPVSVWAKKTNTTKETIFSRLRRGWSESAAITGDSSSYKCNQGKPRAANRPWQKGYEEHWEIRYRESGTDAPPLYFYLIESLSALVSLNSQMSEFIEYKYNPYEPTDEQDAFAKSLNVEIKQYQSFYSDALKKARQKIPHLNQTRDSATSFLCFLQDKAETFIRALK